MALDKPLDDITEDDLLALVDREAESKKIEYKQSLPDKTSSGKKEFLADVSSFANAAGGDLIYGMEEAEGVASRLCGLEVGDVDAEKLRLENMLRDSIRPRIPGINIHPIYLANDNRVAIVIRVPRSWASPHRVETGHEKFYSRNSTGKYSLDVDELKAAFLLSETRAEHIRNFRSDRLGKIIAGETPAILPQGAKIVLHIIPFGAFDPARQYDLNFAYRQSSLCGQVQGNQNLYWGESRYNFDGYLRYAINQQRIIDSYLQFFKNGSIEMVDTYLLKPSLSDVEKCFIPNVIFEQELFTLVKNALIFQKQLNVQPPVLILLSFLDVLGYVMGTDGFLPRFKTLPQIDRSDLLIPEIMVENFECNADEIMKPAFDAVWNACGYPQSQNYDEQGRWKR